MPFSSYIRSDTGFLRKLYQNTGYDWSNCFNAEVPNLYDVSPSSPDLAAVTLYKAPPQSYMTPISVSDFNNLADGEKRTLFGWRLYDDVTNAYTGKLYRVTLRGDGLGSSNLYAEIFEEATSSVIDEQLLTRNVPGHVENMSNYFIMVRLHIAARISLGIVFGFHITGRTYYSLDAGKCQLYLTAGENCIIPVGTDPKVDVVDDPNEDDDGNSGEGGGGGDHDPSSDKIEDGDIDDLNDISASNCGFVTLYKASLSQLQSIAEEMYSTNVWDIVKNWWNKPIEMIAGLMLLPVTPAGGATYRPKIGTHTFTAALQMVSKQYKEVDCGNIYVAEYYGSALDFSPYSKIQLYLPMIGLKELDVDEVMGKWLYVKYRIDCYNGDCIAFVYIGDGVAGNATIRYTFSGNCGQQIPTSSADFSAVINSCVQFATTAVASVISAGAAGAAAGAASSAAVEGGTLAAESAASAAQSVQTAANLKAAGDIGAAGVNAVMNGKPRVDRAGSIGGSLGHMGVLKPFIIRTIPRQSLPKNYKHFYGYPSNISGNVGSFTGYTIFDSVILQNIPGTDTEIAEIDRALKGGVYV